MNSISLNSIYHHFNLPAVSSYRLSTCTISRLSSMTDYWKGSVPNFMNIQTENCQKVWKHTKEAPLQFEAPVYLSFTQCNIYSNRYILTPWPGMTSEDKDKREHLQHVEHTDNRIWITKIGKCPFPHWCCHVTQCLEWSSSYKRGLLMTPTPHPHPCVGVRHVWFTI